jgi:hypothetical protein
MLWSLAIAAVAAAVVGVSTWASWSFGNEISDFNERELAAYKLTVEGKVADATKAGVEAGKAASDAHGVAKKAEADIVKEKARAAAFEKDTAEANLETQRLKNSLAWRELSETQIKTLEGSIQGRLSSVEVDNIIADPESLNLCLQLEGAFRSAGLNIVDGKTVMVVKTIPRGIFLAGRPAETQIMQAALASVGLESSVTNDDKPLSILVASKPRINF